VDRASPDAQSGPMEAEETYQHIFFYFIQALGILAMDPAPQCEAEGYFNVAQELKNGILSGRYVKGLDERIEIHGAVKKCQSLFDAAGRDQRVDGFSNCDSAQSQNSEVLGGLNGVVSRRDQ
jgi:hypothetical protein